MICSGAKVKITGFKSEVAAKMNGVEGVVDHYSHKRGKYVVSLPGGAHMVDECNLEIVENLSSEEAIFKGEQEMMDRLAAMGMPPAMLSNMTASQKKTMFEMTQRQDIIERANARATADTGLAAPQQVLKEEAGGLYFWRDASEFVYLEVPCEVVDKSEVVCKIEADSIRIESTTGKLYLEGDLFQTVDVNASSWAVLDGTITVTLVKAKKMRWLMVLRSV